MNKWQDAAIHVVVAKEQLVEAVAAILARLYEHSLFGIGNIFLQAETYRPHCIDDLPLGYKTLRSGRPTVSF